MKKKYWTAALFLTAFLATSCGLLLGPLSDLSLSQRMAKGWKKIYSFSQDCGLLPSFMNSKLRIVKLPNEIRGYYFVSGGGNVEFYYFNTNSSSNYIYNGSASLQNRFDVTYDRTNSAMIYYDGASLVHYYNSTPSYLSSTYYDPGYNVLVSDIYFSVYKVSGEYSIELTNLFSAGSAVSNVLPSGTMNINNISKCRNKHENSTVIYTLSYNMTNFTNQLILYSLNTFSPMLSSPYDYGMMGNPVLEADQNGRIFMIYNESIYSYNKNTKSFDYESHWPYKQLAGTGTSSTTINFLGDNMLIMHYDANMINEPIYLWTYNTYSKNFSQTTFPKSDDTNDQVIGIDMFHDTESSALYLGILYFKSMGATVMGELYINQM